MQKNMSREAGSGSAGKKFFGILLSALMFMPVFAFAQTASTTPGSGLGRYMRFHHQGKGGSASSTPSTIFAAASTSAVTGTVASVAAESISLNGANSTVYTVDATNAKIYRKFGATMAITDIQTGDSLTVRGTVSGTSVTATTIRDMSQQQKNGTFSGSVTALNGSSFSLQTKNRGLQTINTSSTTVFDKNGKVDSNGLSDIIVGSNVTATGIWDSTASSTDASKVNLIIKNVVTTGVVSAISAPTVTITTKNGTAYTVDTTNAKLIRRYGAALLIADIQTGDTLAVTGPVNATNIAATTVRDESLQAHNGTFTGSITALNGSSFTLQSKNRGPQTINTTDTTTFRLGSASTSIGSLAVGQNATVSGVWDRTNSNVTATRVTIKVGSVTVLGTLQSISGDTLTLLDASSTSYSIDGTNAKVTYKNGHKGDLTILQTNDSLKVSGKEVSGSTNITANTIRDMTQAFTNATTTP